LEYLGGELTNSQVIVDRYVYVVRDTIALRRDITTGIIDGNFVEVLDGLSENELLVTTGQHNLLDSSIVDIVAKRGSL
ncbi:MAG: hypothetical protein PHC43_02845, partial [Candidatus Marinimicrobia bacterium]|nr:hypothetical protein [Candidatus Neomarinimicrobiota bacterium]